MLLPFQGCRCRDSLYTKCLHLGPLSLQSRAVSGGDEVGVPTLSHIRWCMSPNLPQRALHPQEMAAIMAEELGSKREGPEFREVTARKLIVAG